MVPGLGRQGWTVVLAVAAALCGCKPALIPGSSVENTMENREIADVVETYRRGLESRDLNQILKVVSTEYFEDNGTSDPSDDYNYDGLKQHLADDMAKVQANRVTVRLLRIDVDGDRALADFRFQTRSLVGFPSGDQWMTKTDDNRINFKREGGRWMIVAGL